MQLANHAQAAIVENDSDDGYIVASDSKELGAGHLKAAIAAQANGAALRASQLRTHGCRQAEAHGAQAAAGNKLTSELYLQVLSRPHLVLAHVRSNDVILALDDRVQRFEKARRFLIAEIVVHAGPASDFIPPSRQIVGHAALLQQI